MGYEDPVRRRAYLNDYRRRRRVTDPEFRAREKATRKAGRAGRIARTQAATMVDSDRRHAHWTDLELAVLDAHPEMTGRDLAIKLGRTYLGVVVMRNKRRKAQAGSADGGDES